MNKSYYENKGKRLALSGAYCIFPKDSDVSDKLWQRKAIARGYNRQFLYIKAWADILEVDLSTMLRYICYYNHTYSRKSLPEDVVSFLEGVI